ncbi:MAG: hypothetical protein ACREQR_14730 [Candidatus Binataceae bacterium]
MAKGRVAAATRKQNEPVLRVGWWVAVTLKAGAAPLRCYAGEIQAIDDRGLRLTLIDWFSGMAASWDLFIPHSSLESALVCTDQHDSRSFGEAAGNWQEHMVGDPKETQVANGSAPQPDAKVGRRHA